MDLSSFLHTGPTDLTGAVDSFGFARHCGLCSFQCARWHSTLQYLTALQPVQSNELGALQDAHSAGPGGLGQLEVPELP